MTINELLNHFNILPDEIRIFISDAALTYHFEIYRCEDGEHIFNEDSWQKFKKQYLLRKVCDWEWWRKDDIDFLFVCVSDEDSGV